MRCTELILMPFSFAIMAAVQEDYNTGRPHSALGYQTPVAFAANLTATGHRAALSGGSACRPVAHTARKGIICLLYTSDAADEEDSVDLGGRRIIKKKKKITRQ